MAASQTDIESRVDPLLLEVADVVNTTLDLDTTLRRVAELVRKVIDYEIFAILLPGRIQKDNVLFCQKCGPLSVQMRFVDW